MGSVWRQPVPFLERGVELLAPGGRLGFIVPNKLTKLDYGRRLREWLARDGLVEEIVDFGDAQLFEGAANYTCILELSRRPGSELVYPRVGRGERERQQALTSFDAVPAQRFALRELGSDPWVLATGEEARLLRALADGAERLGDVAKQIFQGLITSADPVYIVEDRGRRGAVRRVYSRAADRELELEPDLLHPLASGGDVDRYGFRRLTQLLLFPYRRDGEAMRLLRRDELADLPLTDAYLGEHEAALRGRERGKMDHDGWYGYVYPKSLGAHDHPKLGVPRMCVDLRAAADPEGSVYLDNVDVNGVLIPPEGPSVWSVAVVLNSRAVDWVFRRGSVPFRGEFLSANKQFIAPLPIRVPSGAQAEQVEDLGRRLHELASQETEEREGFLDWLGDALGARVRHLPRAASLAGYEELEVGGVISILRRSRATLGRDPDSRSFRDLLAREHRASAERLGDLLGSVGRLERQADDVVADLYELSRAQRALIARDYPYPGSRP